MTVTNVTDFSVALKYCLKDIMEEKVGQALEFKEPQLYFVLLHLCQNCF